MFVAIAAACIVGHSTRTGCHVMIKPAHSSGQLNNAGVSGYTYQRYRNWPQSFRNSINTSAYTFKCPADTAVQSHTGADTGR